MLRNCLVLLAAVAAAIVASPSHAGIIDEWATITTPPAPALKSVKVDPKTTALLMLDFMPGNCGNNARCLATLPAMKALLTRARAASMTVIYSVIANTTRADILKEVAPMPDEPSVLGGPDKFLRTDLEAMLKNKGITTVITVGTAANGAVLFTGAGAALRGLSVIVPVDGLSARDPYAELTAVFTFTSAPQVSPRATLTRSGMIEF